jgi:NAD(P) transhydrogenase
MDAPIQSLLDGVGETIAAHDAYMAAQLERNQSSCCAAARSFVARPHGSCRCDRSTARSLACARRDHHRHRLAATGPGTCAVDHEHVLDSDSILSLAYLPRSLLVSAAASSPANTRDVRGARLQGHAGRQLDQPLCFLDPELTAFYLEELRRNGGEYIARATAT